jgi:hypothetical protein
VARRQVAALVAGSLLALATALVAVPGIASAHNPNASLSCNTSHSPVLTISLTNYNGATGHHNTVSASIDGVSVLSTTNFAGSYSNTFSAGSPYTSHTAQVVVFAWDDPSGVHGWTTTINLSTRGCQSSTASPTSVPTASPTSVPTASPTSVPTASPTSVPTESPFESFQGETATPATTPTDPAASQTPFESFQGETATVGNSVTPAPTSTGRSGSSNGSTPLFALLICFAFGGLGVGTARMQRRTIRR